MSLDLSAGLLTVAGNVVMVGISNSSVIFQRRRSLRRAGVYYVKFPLRTIPFPPSRMPLFAGPPSWLS